MSRVDDLLQDGTVLMQLSRKHRHVARLPPGMTALQALREHAPKLYADVMKRAEQWATDDYCRYVAEKHGDHFTLSVKEFQEYLHKTGRNPSAWTPSGEACEHCQSLGDRHGLGCPKG